MKIKFTDRVIKGLKETSKPYSRGARARAAA